MKNKEFSKVGWNLSGNIIYALCQWLTISVLSYFGTDSDLGLYTLALAISAPIVMFFMFQLRGILVTEKKELYNFFSFSGARFIHMLLASIVLIVYVLLLKGVTEIAGLTIIVGLNKIIESQSDIYLAGLQKEERTDIVGKSQLLRGLLQLLAFSGLFLLYKNLILSGLATVFISLYRLYFYDKKKLLFILDENKVDKTKWYSLLKLGLPLGVVSLLNSLNTNIPKYFLDSILDVKYVGIFSAFFYFLTAATLVFDPILQILGPKFAINLEENKIKEFKNMIKRVVLFFSLIIVFGFVLLYYLKDPIVVIIYSKKYLPYSYLILYMVPSIYFTGLILLYNLAAIATRNIRSQPIFNLYTLIFSVSTSYFFINSYGLSGAFIALSLNRAFQFLMSYLLYNTGIKKVEKRKETIKF